MAIVEEKQHITIDTLDVLLILLLLFLVYSSRISDSIKKKNTKQQKLITEINNLKTEVDDVNNILKDKPNFHSIKWLKKKLKKL